MAHTMRRMIVATTLCLALLAGGALRFPGVALAQNCTTEVEPNNDPDQAAQVSGALCLQGSLVSLDQDLYAWQVDAAGAGQRWSLTLHPVGGQTTTVSIVQVTFADNGVDVASTKTLLTVIAIGAETKRVDDLLFLPGTYYIGVAAGAEGNYEVDLAPQGNLPPAVETEPNDDRSTASPFAGAADFSGDLATSYDWYHWTLSEEDAQRRWQMEVIGPLGESYALTLYDTNGYQLFYASSDGSMPILRSDLGLAAGDYYLTISPNHEGTFPYIVRTAPQDGRSARVEEEPNDTVDHPYTILDPTQALTGKFQVSADIDFLRFASDENFGKRTWTVALTTPLREKGPDMTLCLVDATGFPIQCREGSQPTLVDLQFAPGDHLLSVRSYGPVTSPYALTFAATGVVKEHFESEPNDTVAQASPIELSSDEGGAMRGRLVGQEDDFYTFTVTGEPQLWRIQALGDGVQDIAILDATGLIVQSRQTFGQRRVRLEDIYLSPGVQTVRVRGEDGDYTLHVFPVGQPAPEPVSVAADASAEQRAATPVTELEPNDDPSRAAVLHFGKAQSGRMDLLDDVDQYRFSLAAQSHLRLTVTPPPDGAVDTGMNNIFGRGERGVGKPFVYDGWLPPGDYFVALSAEQISDGPYQILLEWLNPFTLGADQEPVNNYLSTALELPPGGKLLGWNGGSDDSQDIFRLPVLDAETPVTFSLEGQLYALGVYTGEQRIELLTQQQGTQNFSGTLPAGEALNLRVQAGGPYTLTYGIGGWTKAAPAKPLPVQLGLAASQSEVAAFWQTGQALQTTLFLTNTGDAPLTLRVEAATSDSAWTPALEQSEITLAAGAGGQIPLRVLLLPDATTGDPVMVAVRATPEGGDAAGEQSVAAWPLQAICGAPPAAPDPTWTTAGALFGGIDVAWTALGAKPVGGDDQSGQLYDELVSPATGAHGAPGDRLTVDLAGDDPVQVAGFLLNPQNSSGADDGLAEFEVLLSQDGVTYTPALHGLLGKQQIEQSFALTQPVAARFAQLQLLSSWNPQAQSRIGVGEFKVVAVAGSGVLTVPVNLADLDKGGHIVSSQPLMGDPTQILSRQQQQPLTGAEPASPVEWVVGFHDNRAAQIVEFGWTNWPSGDTLRNFSQVQIFASTESPNGPWQSLGTWQLDPNNETSRQTYSLPQPLWARFVRFVAEGSAERSTYDYPDPLEIIERGEEGAYTSILAEYGHYRQAAVYEELAKPEVVADQEAAGGAANDSVASAQVLTTGAPVASTVEQMVDEDWYRLEIPQNDNLLVLTLDGEAGVGVDYAVFADAPALTDTAASTPPLAQGSSLGHTLITATVTPGTVVYVHLTQPKRSVVFSWDTSGSVGPYTTAIYQSLQGFARDVDPQREVVNLLPFGEPGAFLLKDWSGDPVQVLQALNNYNRADSSSNAELNLLTATRALGERPGTRAVLLMTDAESNGYDQTINLWNALEQVQPRVFTFEISTAGEAHSQDLMQDWANANHGEYGFMSTIGEFENGFARASCVLRRPATYQLSAALSFALVPTPTPIPTATPEATAPPTMTPSPTPTLTPESTATPTPTLEPTATTTPAEPGSVQVISPPAQPGAPSVTSGAVVELILDASGSMLQPLEGQRRIDIAKQVLTQLVTQVLPPRTQLALRVFGHLEANSCRTDLELPLQVVDPTAVSNRIAGIEARNLARTPIADSLLKVADDLAAWQGPKIVILVTDGEETCDGDPEAAIRSLKDQGIDVRINIVGFAVADEALKQQFEEWATLGGGFYYDATNSAELEAAVTQALAPTFHLLDASGAVVGTGIVNGDEVDVPPGTYTLEVLEDPVRRVEGIVVPSGEVVVVKVGH